LNKTLSVGSLGGTIDVSSLGGAVYSIPIPLPEGINGMTPQLAITYNSHGGNGVLGPGWGLSGLSTITRTLRNLYHDGVASVPKWMSDDDNRLMLDGQRLIATGSVPGLEAAEYRTEVESYASIKKMGSGNSRYFVVTTKDGRTIEYGVEDEARTGFGISPSANPLAWWINKVTDPDGNYIRYIYDRIKVLYPSDEKYIQRIEYGNGNSVIASVVFGYNKRNDFQRIALYSPSFTVQTSVLLKQITVYDGSVRSGKYTFNYEYVDALSKLIEIVPENGYGEKLNSTRFTWTKPTVVMNSAPVPTCSFNTDNTYTTGDFNGDGITDVLEINKKGTTITLRASNTIGACQSAYSLKVTEQSSSLSGFPCLYYTLQLVQACQGNYCADYQIKIIDEFAKIQGYAVGDFDGDGKSELALLTHKYELKPGAICDKPEPTIVGNHTLSNAVVTIYKFEGDKWVWKNEKEFARSATLSKQTIDFNHDGKADLVIGDEIYSFDSYFTFSKLGDTNYTSLFSDAFWCDLDGDGKMDFIAKGSVYYQEKNPDNYSFKQPQSLPSNLFLGAAIDINGDGFFREILDSYSINVFELHGDNVYLSSVGGSYSQAIVADIDADGRPDILLCSASKADLSDLTVKRIYYQIRWSSSDSKYTCQTIENCNILIGKVLIGDFNGGGIPSLLSIATGNILKFTSAGIPGTKLASIIDGFNQKTEIHYKALTPNIDFYIRGTNPHPAPSFAGAFYAVRSIKQDNGDLAPVVTEYSYKNARIHTQGKGFLGFASITATNTTTGISVENSTLLHSTYYMPTQTKSIVTVKDGATTKTLSETTVNFIILQVNPSMHSKYIRTYPHEKIEKDVDGNTTTTSYAVNNDGNITSEAVVYADLSTKTVSYSDFATVTGSTIPSLPKTVTVTQKHVDDMSNPFSNTTTFLYDTKGHVTQKKENDGITGKEITSDFDYDDYGNLTQTKLSYNNPSNAVKTTTTTYKYDASNRYVETRTVKAPNNQTETTFYQYDNRGNMLNKRDLYGETHYQYDYWNRLVATHYPDGRQETTAQLWNQGNTPLYKVTQTRTGEHDVTTHYDAVGRKWQTLTKGPKNSDVDVWYFYNKKGQVVEEISANADLLLFAHYDYYADGRLNNQYTNSGTTTYTYQPRQVTVTQDGKNTVTEYDSWGNIKKSTDRMGNEVTYSYKSSGKPGSISAINATYSFEYDATGNRTELNDPSAGIITTQYDALGRITSQTDAKGQQQTTAYDDWGRITTLKDVNTNTIIKYDYVSEGNGKGKIQKITDQKSQHSIAYEYDALHRPVKETRYIKDEGNFVTSYAYNSNSDISSVTYPNDVTETRTYENGFLDKVSVNGAQVWKRDTYTGTSVTATLGTNLQTTASYNPDGLLTGLKTQKGATVIRNFGYNFNGANGMLDTRTGMNGTENFTYDDLYRLETVNVPPMNVNYYPNGNIQNKTGVVNYTYSGKPYQLSEVDNPTGLVTEQETAYTWFNKPARVATPDFLPNPEYDLNIAYGPDFERVKTTLKKNGNVIKDVIFVGNYERVIKGDITTHFHYISGGDGLCAIYVKQTKGASTLKNGIYYVHPDHLGSLAIITDASGNIKQKCTFDAWGQRTFDTSVSDPTLVFDRGYTGHEHLDEFGLINMNARLYDPLLGRFLAPDPYVQNPLLSQNFNRYAYCLNNPLIYIDPDGESLTAFIIGVLVYAAIEYGTQVYYNYQVSKQLEAQGLKELSNSQIWLGRIDWFDVAFNGLGGGVSMICPVAAPWIMYGTPFVTNAINIYGDGQVQTVFNGNIPIEQYLFNTGVEVFSLYATNIVKTALATPAKNVLNPQNHTKYFTKEVLGKDITMRSIEDMIQQATASWMDYSIKAPVYPAFNPDRLWYPDGTPVFPNYQNKSNDPTISPYSPKYQHYNIKKNKVEDNDLAKYLQLYPAR
jgi:RHS repeat-associated protein